MQVNTKYNPTTGTATKKTALPGQMKYPATPTKKWHLLTWAFEIISFIHNVEYKQHFYPEKRYRAMELKLNGLESNVVKTSKVTPCLIMLMLYSEGNWQLI